MVVTSWSVVWHEPQRLRQRALLEQGEETRSAAAAVGERIVHMHVSFAERPQFTYRPGVIRYEPVAPAHPAVSIGQGTLDGGG